jgi:hypothetical protein
MVTPVSFQRLMTVVVLLVVIAFGVTCTAAAMKGDYQMAGLGGVMGVITLFGLITVAFIADENRR